MNQQRILAVGLLLVLAGTVAGAAVLGVLPGTGESDGAQPEPGNETQPEPRNETQPEPRTETQYPAQVDLYDGDEHVATIDAETATNRSERITGLSNHEQLNDTEGMLFVYDDPDDRTYVMRRMSFGIDIMFVSAQGCIDAAHAAPQPAPGEDGESEEHKYSGHGQYVLEVPIGVATDNGVDEGDPVRIEHDGSVLDGRENCTAS